MTDNTFRTVYEAEAFDKVRREALATPDIELDRKTMWLGARAYFEGLDRQKESRVEEATIKHSDARFQELALSFAVQAIAHDKSLDVFAAAENFRLFLLNTHTPRLLSVSEDTAIFQGPDGPMVFHRQSPLDGMELG